jgi:hypothetical protein
MHKREIVAQANRHLHGAVDFAVLPGDNDFKARDLAAFYAVPGAQSLPKALTVGAYRCLFLDFVSAGTGGPDFRLGHAQMAWLQHELHSAGAAGLRCAVFAHAYPADLAERAEAAAFHALLRQHRVLVLDMGHTHYNELANDGCTIYAATRSTGQIEEGPVGFSVLALDHDVVSWRFKPLAQAWSGAGIEHVECQVNHGAWQVMHAQAHTPGWRCECLLPPGAVCLGVRATDVHGGCDEDRIEISASGQHRSATAGAGPASDRYAMGAWPAKHLLGTQLGPNRNGQKW